MEKCAEGIDTEHVRDQLYQLIVSQLMYDTHTTLADGIRSVCSVKREMCRASDDLLHLLYPILNNRTDAGVQCDILSDTSDKSGEEPKYRPDEQTDDSTHPPSKSNLDAMTQTLPHGSAVDSIDATEHKDTGPTKRKRGRPKKSESKEMSRSRSRNVKLKRQEAKVKGDEMLNSPENKRKQRKPQKVLSPDHDKDKDASEEENEKCDLLAGEIEEEKYAEKDEEQWEDEVPKVKKKRGRKPKLKKEKSEIDSEKEAYVAGRPHGKRHTTCYGCDMTFTKSTDCHNHVLSHFLETETQKICKICNKTLAKSTMHQDHLKIHSSIRSFLCNVCGATFNRKSSYDNHMEKHSRKKLYCEKCGNGPYNTAKQYERHIAVFHVGQMTKKWMCDICGKGFYQKNKLDSHVRIHTGERPYTCSFCPATFRCKPHVQRHEEQHKGKKRFTCGVCNHATFQRSNMKVHMRVHSAVSYAETKLFVCALCRSCFHSNDLFEIHKSTKHPNYEQDMDTLTDTIGIGKVKMLINPPNRIQPPSKSDEVTDPSQFSKPKKAPRMKIKTYKAEGVNEGVDGNAASNIMIQQINCLSNDQGQIISVHEQPPLSQVQQTELSSTNLTNSNVVNSFNTPPSSIQQVLYTGASHQPLQTINSASVPMDYTVATDYSMLMQSVAAAAHVSSTNPSSGVHPSFLQQHQHFNNLH